MHSSVFSRHEEGISWLDRAIEFGREWEERSFRFTARGMNMRAGAIREIGDLDAARAQSEEALELAKDSGFRQPRSAPGWISCS